MRATSTAPAWLSTGLHQAIKARMLRRDDGDRSEIITFSLWDSHDSIRAFAGEDIDQAVFYPEDDRFLIERDELVRHYEVVA